jgi:lipopolysaccharide transport protein LptA
VSRLAAVGLIVFCVSAVELPGEPANSPGPSPTAAAKKEKKEKKSDDKTSPLTSGLKGASTNGPVTTEIYADDALFDSNKNVGVFSGHVKVADPRFTLQSEKLTVYITKGQNQGLEKAIAEGNVAVVRDRPDPNGGAPTRAVGRADQAIYTAATGNVELHGTPRVQEGVNTHIATSPETVMVVNQNGQLTTHGPSRTEIRQEPKSEEGEKKGESKPETSPKASATP